MSSVGSLPQNDQLVTLPAPRADVGAGDTCRGVEAGRADAVSGRA